MQTSYNCHLELINKNYNFYATTYNERQDISIHSFMCDNQQYYYVKLMGDNWFKNYVFDKDKFVKLFDQLYSTFNKITISNESPFVNIDEFVKCYSADSFLNDVHSQLLHLLISSKKINIPPALEKITKIYIPKKLPESFNDKPVKHVKFKPTLEKITEGGIIEEVILNENDTLEPDMFLNIPIKNDMIEENISSKNVLDPSSHEKLPSQFDIRYF